MYSAITVGAAAKAILLLTSFLAFSLIHFCVTSFLATSLSLTKESARPYFLTFNIIVLFLASIVLYSIAGGYYAGITNWGQAVDYKLFSDIILRPFSFTDFLWRHEYATLIVVGSSLTTLLTFIYYYYQKNELSAISNYFSAKKALGFGSLLLPIFLLGGMASVSKPSLADSFFKDEMLVSFVNPLDPIDMMKNDNQTGEEENITIKRKENFDKKNVIIISVECLRNDHLSFSGYHRKTMPYLESLYNAGKLVKMDWSTSTCANTFCGVLSILNSKTYKNFGNFKLGIHDYLRKQGYHINFLLSGLHDSFSNLKEYYGENIDTYIESKMYPQFNINDDEFIFKALQDVKDSDGTPNFFFVHLMSPHIGGFKQKRFDIFQPSMNYASLVKRQSRTIDIDSDAITLFTNSYDNSLVQADDIIKRFLQQLKLKGFMDNTVVAIVGDHGESMGEHNKKFGHKHGLWQEYIGVPIMFIDDDISFYKERTYGSQIDIAPTIVDRLQLPIPKTWEGRTLKNKIKARTTFHETQNGDGHSVLASVSKNGNKMNKFIYIPDTDERFFYNLTIDPKEQRNIIDKCKKPQKFINRILQYQSKKSKRRVERNKKNNATAKKPKSIAPKTKKPHFADFLTKNFLKKHLKIQETIFRNNDQSDAKSSTTLFTWSEKNASNTLIVEIQNFVDNTNSAQVLSQKGVKTTHKEWKQLQPFGLNGETYFFSADHKDIAKFYKKKRIRISSINQSQHIDRATLIELVSAIEKEL